MASPTRTDNDRVVTAMFNDHQDAERAYSSARDRGYADDDVSVIMSDETRDRHYGDKEHVDTELGNKAAEGAGVGGAIGGTVGGIAGALAAVGTSLALPGLGLVVAGPLAAALAGAGAGGLGGSLLGGLIGAGIPEERVKRYEEGVKEGGIVMGVKPRSDEDADYFEREFQEHRGVHVYR